MRRGRSPSCIGQVSTGPGLGRGGGVNYGEAAKFCLIIHMYMGSSILLSYQTRRDPLFCPPEFETLVGTRLLPDVLRLSTEDITNLNCKGYLAIALDTNIVDDL